MRRKSTIQSILRRWHITNDPDFITLSFSFSLKCEEVFGSHELTTHWCLVRLLAACLTSDSMLTVYLMSAAWTDTFSARACVRRHVVTNEVDKRVDNLLLSVCVCVLDLD
jgi:hypothetical protein